MRRNEIMINQIKTMLHDRFGISPDRMDDDSRMRELGIDSLHLVDLMLDIETTFGFRYEALALSVNPSLQEIADAIAAGMSMQ